MISKESFLLFTDLNLKLSSLKAVEKMGFEEPSEIQEKAIPILTASDVDFVGQAQTGTGKTAAFVLPLLEKIDLKNNNVQALIVSPTRELAIQIQQEIEKLSEFEPVRSMTVYGGTSVGLQIRDLKKIRPQIVVGTPGRIMDFINREVLDLAQVKYAILDEADEMLDMGFFQDIKTILSCIPNKKIWMFSATMPTEIEMLIKKFFCEPQFVRIKKKHLTNDSVDQQYVMVHESQLTEALCRYLDYQKDIYGIIFTRTKIMAKELADSLAARGYTTDSLHGDMSQDQRDLSMKKFKDKEVKLLVCTDVAARGIDVNDLTHVINYELPQDNEAYVHRIGRTGRGGKEGVALSIISPNEHKRLSQIEAITKATVERAELPEISKIRSKLVQKNIESIKSYVNAELEDEDLYDSFVHLFESETKESLVKGLFNYFYAKNLYRYKDAEKIDVRPKRPPRPVKDGFTRLFTNIGRENGFEIGDLIRIICRNTKVPGQAIGKIDFKTSFSFIEIPTEFAQEVLDLNGKEYKDFQVSFQPCRNFDDNKRGKNNYRKGPRSNNDRKDFKSNRNSKNHRSSYKENRPN